MMDYEHAMEYLRRGAWLFLLRYTMVWLSAIGLSIADDSIGGIPSTGLLCISDCATCPVICAPPPPPTLTPSPPPPPHMHYSPPESYTIHMSPPPPPSPPPPTYYFSWGTPPPPVNYPNGPAFPSPPVIDTRGYSYPYYYFYASKAPHRWLPFFSSSLMIIVISTCVCLCCL